MNLANQKSAPLTATEASLRLPMLALTLGGLAWLLCGLLLSMLANFVLHEPAWGGCEYFGYGRLAAASRVALIYGFAVPTGLAVGLWVLFNLSQVRLSLGVVVAVAAGFWNLGVVAGVGGILLGETTGLRGFELPVYAGGILLGAYLLMVLSILPEFGLSAKGSLQLPQLMVVAAMLWFPWLLTSAEVFLVWYPVRGVLAPLTASWYAQGLFWGCLAPLTLAGMLHFRGESLGTSMSRPGLAHLGFWSLLLVAGWTGASLLVGGPVPAWIASVGVVAGVLLAIPVVLLGINLYSGGFFRCNGQATVRLTSLAALAFWAGGLLTAVTSLRCAQRILHFTQFASALQNLLLLGFIVLGLLSALYVILPKMIGFNWARFPLAPIHFGLSGVGLVLIVGAGIVGGWRQGQHLDLTTFAINDANLELVWWLRLACLGWLAFTAAQAAFVLNVVLLTVGHFPAIKQFAWTLIKEESAPAGEWVRATK